MNKLQIELVKFKKAIETIARRNGFDYVGVSFEITQAYVCLFINGTIKVSGYVPTNIKGAKQRVDELVKEHKRNSQS